MREEPPKPMISLEALRDEIHRIRAHSQENMTINADLIEVQREEIEKETKRIESVRVDIELKSLVNRIKGVTTQIKDKVKKHKELSESILSEQEEAISENDMTIAIDDINYEVKNTQEYNIAAVNAEVSLKLPQRPKSGGFSRGNRTNLLIANYTTNTQPLNNLLSPKGFKGGEDLNLTRIDLVDETNDAVSENLFQVDYSRFIPIDVFKQVITTLKAKHYAEKDSLLCELQVFKAVIEGMASKIRYLQEYKLDREQLQIDLIKYKHQNEKVKREMRELREENRELRKNIDRMKEAVLLYEHEIVDRGNEEAQMLDQLMVENQNLRKMLKIN